MAARNPAPAKKTTRAGKAAAPVKATKASKPAAKPEVRRRADWEAIERDYRTGKFTDQELADKHGSIVTRQAISKRAKEKGWQKDLSAAVRQATKASLIQAQVQEAVAGKVAESCVATTNAVLAAAEANKQVILEHRRDIQDTRALVHSMLGELKLTSLDRERLARLIDTMGKDAEASASQLQEARLAFAELTRLSSRVLTANRLVQAMGRLQQLERTAFGLDEPEQPPPVDEMADLSDEDLEQRIRERRERLGIS